VNLCRACSEDFASVSAFDRHRTGDHELDFPEHPDGRRCRDDREMREVGMELDSSGRWRIALSEADRERLAGLRMGPESKRVARRAPAGGSVGGFAG
jgi:hypothetical protein